MATKARCKRCGSYVSAELDQCEPRVVVRQAPVPPVMWAVILLPWVLFAVAIGRWWVQ